MFDIGFQELIIIFLVALLVFGPERLPETARTLGRWINEIRRGISNAKMQIETELEVDERNSAKETKMNHRPADKDKDSLSADKEKEGE